MMTQFSGGGKKEGVLTRLVLLTCWETCGVELEFSLDLWKNISQLLLRCSGYSKVVMSS